MKTPEMPILKIHDTVDIFIMHNVIMHNSHTAWLSDRNHHGTQGNRVHNAYWIMHRFGNQIMHYQNGFLAYA